MRVEHLGRQPLVDPSAWIAPNAVLSGPVTIGPNTRVLYGAVLTAECGAEVVVGAECVIMEHADRVRPERPNVRGVDVVAHRQEG